MTLKPTPAWKTSWRWPWAGKLPRQTVAGLERMKARRARSKLWAARFQPNNGRFDESYEVDAGTPRSRAPHARRSLSIRGRR